MLLFPPVRAPPGAPRVAPTGRTERLVGLSLRVTIQKALAAATGPDDARALTLDALSDPPWRVAPASPMGGGVADGVVSLVALERVA